MFLFRTLIIICALVLQTLEATVVISLGGDCAVAIWQRNLDIRKAAYPFDWVFSSYQSIYSAIEDDFQHLLDTSSLRVAVDNRVVLDFYNIKYVHDFPTIHHPVELDDHPREWAEIREDWLSFAPAIQEKYLRRVQRFREACLGTDHVIFVRLTFESKDEVVKLRNLIKDRYPNLSFDIAAIVKKIEIFNEFDSDLEHIKPFYLPSDQFWVKEQWESIYRSLGVSF